MLIGGARVWKDDPRVEAYGAIDELNSSLGVVLSRLQLGEVKRVLRPLQALLFRVGAELANPGDVPPKIRITRRDVLRVEGWTDRFNREIQPIAAFVHPTGTEAGALLHLSRAIARRAERRIVTLSRRERVNPHLIALVNRLSSLLYALARYVNEKEGWREVVWKSWRQAR
jgi:cob(I)alamin adenosyltransferase